MKTHQMKSKLIAFLTILIVGWGPKAVAQSENTAEQAVTLAVGDPAPALTYAKWYKGAPVHQFESGHIYVVEFWATWCGPCRMAMPHLSELAEKYRDQVTVIGFNVRENSDPDDPSEQYLGKVDQFVTAIGEGMDYSVAVDVPGQKTWRDWMVASGQRGIPTTFVVDAEGKIAWIGHPFGGLDLVIDQMLKGGVPDADKITEQATGRNQYLKDIQARFFALTKEGKYQEAFELGQEIVEKVHMGKAIFAVSAYDALKEVDPERADQYLRGLVPMFSNDPMNLQTLAQTLIDRENPRERRLATIAIDRSLEKSSDSDSFVHNLAASIHFKAGNIKRAIALQERTIEIVQRGENTSRKDAAIEGAKELLEKYKAAL